MKLFKKIAFVSVSAMMAIGAGFSFANVSLKKAHATGEGSATLAVSTTSTYYVDGYLVPDTGASTTAASFTATQFTVNWLKNSASSNIVYNYAEIRAYTGHSLTFTPASGYQITSIVANAASASYASALGNSTWTNAAPSVSSSTVTITPTVGSSACSVTLTAQSRINTLVVNYANASTDPVINLDKSALSFETGGDSQTITATYANLTGTLTWLSLDTSVCTVADGVVTPVGIGSTTVRAYDSGNEATKGECSVTVIAASITALDINLGYSAENTTRFAAYASTVADEVIYSTADLGNAGLMWTVTVTPNSGQKASISNNNYETNGSSQFGKKSYSAATAVVRSDYFSLSSGNAISRIDLKAGGAASGSTGTISVSVGGTPLTCETSNTFNGNSTIDYKFTSATPLLGRIEITFTNNATPSTSAGMKLVEVIIKDVTKDTSDNGVAMDFMASLEECDSCVGSASVLSTYDGLSSSVKAIVDEMSVFDYAATDTAKSGAKIVSFTVAQKIAQLSLIGSGSPSANVSFYTTSSTAVLMIAIVSFSALVATAGYFLLKKKKEVK